MKGIFRTLSVSILVFQTTVSNCLSQVSAISGTINTVATAVTAVNNGSAIDVQTSAGFNVNDTVLIIQMKGASVDTTNTASFGNIQSIGNAGNYEFATICNISGATITFQTPLAHAYTPTGGYVQLIRISSYTDINVTGPLTAPAWNGFSGTGGVLALIANGTITLNADISMNGKGFRGGWSQSDYSTCTCGCSPSDPQYTDYYFASGSCRAAGKGEGIADSIPGKEFGRGKLANGGGGGNDHNGGGAGGANYATGGSGGTASAPTCFFGSYCRGNYPGVASLGLSTPYSNTDKLFLGGGGGAGHANNLAGMNGGAGGGIIIIVANSLVGQGYSVTASGMDVTTYNDGDGQGGGGAGGSLALDVTTFSGSLNLDVSGGQGGNIDSYSASNCKGPGGGGGGGVIRTPSALPGSVTSILTGGASGIQTGPNCTGQTNGATAGANGSIIYGLSIGIGASSAITSVDTQVACNSYTWIDGNTYTSSNNAATWTLTNTAGCDSIIQLDLTINSAATGVDVITTCGSYTWIDGNTYSSNTNTPTHTFVGGATNGCDSIVTLNLTITSYASGTDIVTSCDSYNWIDGNSYTSSTNTPTYTYFGGAANGCDSIVTLNLTLNNSVSTTDMISACDTYTWIDGNTYTSSTSSPSWLLTSSSGCDSLVNLVLTISNSSNGTDIINACEPYTWIDGITYTSSNSTAIWNLTNAAGCDSVVTLNLTMNSMPAVVVVQNNITLSALQSGATYQWLNCDDNYSIIGGATGQQFTPVTPTGNYAVEVNLNGCIDTSFCYYIDYSGLSDLYKDILSVNPNPTSDALYIHGLDQVTGFVRIEITSASGELVVKPDGKKETIKVSDLPAGVYFLRIYHAKGVETIRFIKQ